MNLVVGSGPAGVACAQALLERGRPVTMLDAGIDLEPENQERAERLGSVPPSDWRPDDLSAWRRCPPDGNAVPVKRVHGSDFFQRAPAEAPALRQSGALALRSYAVGGLSRAWGATFAPFPEEELSRWPAEARNLAPHYEAVLRYVPAAGLSSDPLSLSPQADLLWRRMTEARTSLSEAGLTLTRSVLAVHTAGPKGCRYCGGCLRGCPYGSIYSAADTLETLRGREGFTYVPGVATDACAFAAKNPSFASMYAIAVPKKPLPACQRNSRRVLLQGKLNIIRHQTHGQESVGVAVHVASIPIHKLIRIHQHQAQRDKRITRILLRVT